MAQQTIPILSSGYIEFSSNIRWVYTDPADRPQVNANLTDGNDRFFGYLALRDANGRLTIRFTSDRTEATSLAGDDLSSAFETSGSVTITVGSFSLTIDMASNDTDEPYEFIPPNSADLISFVASLRALSNVPDGTLVLDDGATPDAPGSPTLVSATLRPNDTDAKLEYTLPVGSGSVTEVEYRIDGGAWQTGEFTRQGIKPITTTAQDMTDDFVPTGFTDDPVGVDDEYPNEYISVRDGSTDDWMKFSLPARAFGEGEPGEPGGPGEPGEDGEPGVSVTGFNQVGDIITVTFSDGTSDDFTVTSLTVTNVETNADGDLEITFSDMTTVTIPQGVAGNGISDITRDDMTGLVTITFDDNTIRTFTVNDGEIGADGKPGIPGASMIMTYDDIRTTINVAGGYKFSNSASYTGANLTAWASVQGAAYFYVHESDKDSTDHTDYYDQISVGDIFVYYVSATFWGDWQISSVDKSGNVYRFCLTFIESDDTDSETISDGDIMLRWSRAPKGEDGLDGDPGTRGISNYDRSILFTYYNPTLSLVNGSGTEWHIPSGDIPISLGIPTGWSDDIDFYFHLDDQGLINDVNIIGIRCFKLRYIKTADNWADYEVGDIEVETTYHGLTGLTLIESEGNLGSTCYGG